MLVPKSFTDLITFSRSSAGWYYNSAGVLVQAGANIPRFDYDPVTRQPRGLLIEESRSNLLTYSQDYADASWSKTRVAVTPNATLAPDGTSSAAKIVEDTSNNTHVLLKTFSASPSTVYTYSTFVKAAERSVALVQVGNFGAQVAPNAVYVNLATGEFSATDPNRTQVSKVGNGWFRVATTVTTTSTGTPIQPSIYAAQAMGSSTYQGDGVSGIYAWGSQLEAGPFATSYIPTTASQGARAADSASVTGTNAIASSAGSVVCEAAQFGESNAAPRIWQLRSANGDLAQGITRLSTSRVYGEAYVQAVYQASLASAIGEGTFRAGFAWGADDFAASANGSQPVVDQSGIAPSFGATSVLWLGRDAGTQRHLNGWIRSLRFFPYRLSNAELQALTA